VADERENYQERHWLVRGHLAQFLRAHPPELDQWLRALPVAEKQRIADLAYASLRGVLTEDAPPLDKREVLLTALVVFSPQSPSAAGAESVRLPDAAKPTRVQLQTLVMALIWLMAVIVPIVQQRLSAEGQSVTEAEVGTVGLALAATALLKQARK
jgi:hypothetical protein